MPEMWVSRLISDIGRSGEVPVQVRVGSEMVLGWFQTVIKILVQVSGWFQRSGVLAGWVARSEGELDRCSLAAVTLPITIAVGDTTWLIAHLCPNLPTNRQQHESQPEKKSLLKPGLICQGTHCCTRQCYPRRIRSHQPAALLLCAQLNP